MRYRITPALIVVLSLLCMGAALTQSVGIESSPYVYRLKIGGCTFQPTERRQTGFQVEGQIGIVTALHGVVDCKTISAVSDDGQEIFNDLSIRKVDIEQDIVLLSSVELDSLPDKGLAISTLTDAEIRETKFRVVGYPLGLDKQDIEANIIIRDIESLDNVIPDDEEPTSFIKRKSPSIGIDVLNVQAQLLPGHSGAPLLDSNNRLVGIADGGLRGGTIGRSWAILWRNEHLQSVEVADVKENLDELAEKDPSALSFSSTYPISSFMETAEHKLVAFVVDKATGNPLSRAEVTLTFKDGYGYLIAYTDSKGAFSFTLDEDLANNLSELLVELEGYQNVNYTLENNKLPTDKIGLAPHATLEPKVTAITRVCPIKLRVFAARPQTAIEGAQVTFTYHGKLQSNFTNSDGYASVTFSCNETYPIVEIDVSFEGYVSVVGKEIEFSGDDERIYLTLATPTPTPSATPTPILPTETPTPSSTSTPTSMIGQTNTPTPSLPPTNTLPTTLGETATAIFQSAIAATLTAVASTPNLTATMQAAIETAVAATLIASAPTVTPTLTNTPTPSVKSTSTPTAEMLCTVIVSGLNVRAGPGTNYPRIGSLREGEQFRPQGRNQVTTWLEIEIGSTGKVGWVSAAPQFVTCTINIGTLPVVTTPSPLPTYTPTNTSIVRTCLTPAEVRSWCEGDLCTPDRFEQLQEANGVINLCGVKLKTGDPVAFNIPAGVSVDVWDCFGASNVTGPVRLPQVCEASFRRSPSSPSTPTSVSSAKAIPVATLALPSGAPATKTIVTVKANEDWQNTGISIIEGAKLEIHYISGEWTVNNRNPSFDYWVDADGYKDSEHGRYGPLTSANLGAVIAKIGGGDIFLVGKQTTFVATSSGSVWLRINDGDCAECSTPLGDNEGEIIMALVVQSSPPTPTRLPADRECPCSGVGPSIIEAWGPEDKDYLVRIEASQTYDWGGRGHVWDLSSQQELDNTWVWKVPDHQKLYPTGEEGVIPPGMVIRSKP